MRHLKRERERDNLRCEVYNACNRSLICSKHEKANRMLQRVCLIRNCNSINLKEIKDSSALKRRKPSFALFVVRSIKTNETF